MKTRQQGVTLVVALIMLVLLTLLVITGVNVGKSSFQAVTNMQQRNEVQSAAQDIIEQAISNRRFVDSPDAIFIEPCGGMQNKKCVDTNGDGVTDVTVNVVSNCIKAQPKPNDTLNLKSQFEASCAVQVDQDQMSLEGGNGNSSSCWDSTWEVVATATDQVTNATVAVTQGIRVVASKNAVDTSCK